MFIPVQDGQCLSLRSHSLLVGRLLLLEWLRSRVVNVLESGAEGPGFKSQSRRCRVTVLGKTVHTHCASVHQAAKLVAALLRVARVTAGLAESYGSLAPGLLLISPAGWLSRTGTSSGTLSSVIEYGLPIGFCEWYNDDENRQMSLGNQWVTVNSRQQDGRTDGSVALAD